MGRRYTDTDGYSLCAYEAARGEYSVAWGYSENGSFEIGLVLGLPYGGNNSDEDEVVERVLTSFLEATPGARVEGNELIMPSMQSANRLKNTLNEALLAYKANKPWPEWATKAKAAGWIPPKNWTP